MRLSHRPETWHPYHSAGPPQGVRLCPWDRGESRLGRRHRSSPPPTRPHLPPEQRPALGQPSRELEVGRPPVRKRWHAPARPAFQGHVRQLQAPGRGSGPDPAVEGGGAHLTGPSAVELMTASGRPIVKALPVPHRTFDLDLAAEQFGQPRGHGEAEAQTRRASPPGGLGTVEGVEQAGDLVRGDARRHDPRRSSARPASPPQPDEDRRPRLAVLAGVVEQVVQQFAQQRRMGADRSAAPPARRPAGRRPALGPSAGRRGGRGNQASRSSGSRCGRWDSASARARNRRASTICRRCRVLPWTSVRTRRYSSAVRSCRKARSTCPCIAVSGVRSWCEASPGEPPLPLVGLVRAGRAGR